jgi:hypothetical protein
MRKLLDKFNLWSLYYRQEIVWFTIGSLTTLILLIILSILI